MNNRITAVQYDPRCQEDRGRGPKPVGEILAELLALYEVRYPEAKIVVVETPVAA